MPPTITWDNIPQALLTDYAQLVKANSVVQLINRLMIDLKGTCRKKDNLTIIYTLENGNLGKKSGDMAVGQVSFHSDKQVLIIVNRLNKTKVERVVNHEQERIDHIKKEDADERATAVTVEEDFVYPYGLV